MPLIFEWRLSRQTIRANPDRLYLFGDNEQRTGFGGQAKEARGEPNAIGVRTKRAPTMKEDDIWTDIDFDRCSSLIDRDLDRAFDHIRTGGVVVCPRDGIGTGRAKLPETAPRIFYHLRQRIVELKRAGQIP